MSLFHKRSLMSTADTELARLTNLRLSGPIGGPDAALRISAAWACRRLRADLISTMPVDVFRNVQGVQFEVTTPPVLSKPDGRIDIVEWLYDTQVDLDSYGNCYGLITARDGAGRPTRIELVPAAQVAVNVQQGKMVGYRVGSEQFGMDDIWHERQYTMSGCPVGLSPLAYAAMSTSTYLSAQAFAMDWYRGMAKPAAALKNTAKTITQDEAERVKGRFKSTVGAGDLFVYGSDWTYEMISAKANETEFLQSMEGSLQDICRFMGVPGDLVDVNSSSGSITYANITQRNMQFLIMNLQPAITRRERALSDLTPKPQFVKLNTSALLRMDDAGRANLNRVLLETRQRTVTEVREKDDLPPYTPAQEDEVTKWFPAGQPVPVISKPTGPEAP